MPNVIPTTSPQTSSPVPTLLSMEGIDKSFPGVQALRRAQLTLFRGEVLALLGENGAGKSTLIKILAGAHRADSGRMRLDGQTVEMAFPLQAQEAGIAVIYQEFNLVPDLTVRENLFLGREPSFFLQPSRERREARKILQRLETGIDPETHCRTLSVARQQMVEIAKALSQEARILVMDEPTAALSPQEAEQLFRVIQDLQAQGLGIIFITHRLEEVFRVADRITIMRDGEHVATGPVGDFDRRRIIELMAGRLLESEFPSRNSRIGGIRLSVEGLGRGQDVRDVDFQLRSGEVLGITGLVGAGRTELARLIFGADRCDRGQVVLDGQTLRCRSPREAIQQGISLLTEDRKSQGLFLGHSILANFAVANLSHWSKAGLVDADALSRAFAGYAESLKIKAHDPEAAIATLSGGNQQKVLVARWLESRSKVLIFDEPTRGIDVGAKFDIYCLINQLAESGKAIILISSEFGEVLGMCNRILVMHEGRISGQIREPSQATQERILELAVS